jgi:ATP-dependent DNA helicase RecG
MPSELTRLTGLGPKREKALEAAGIRTLRELVYHVPRRYVDRTKLTPIATLGEGDDAFFTAVIDGVKTPPGRLIVSVTDETGSIELAFFNSAQFLRQQLTPGRRISVAGVVKRFRSLQIAHPEWEVLREDQDPRGGLLPVYPLTEDLADTRAEHKLLQKFALEALDKFSFSDPLALPERTMLKLRAEKDVLRLLHAPQSHEDIETARFEMKVRELWPLCLRRAVARRQRRARGKSFPATPSAAAAVEKAEAAVRAALPFALTKGQEDVLATIATSLETGGQFFGLLHGDVGSGKTAVALLSALRVMATEGEAKGSQVALLAPTEILAVQHFRTAEPWLRAAGLRAALLTGETDTPTRQNILAGLQDGSISFVVGTHALLTPSVTFRDLRYVLVDEQHRFGVEQRAVLTAKGVEPHVLYLSATPIPRTLAQSLYGDMDVLTLKEKPAGRLPIKTRLVPAAKQPELLSFLFSEANRDGEKITNQIYWVVPRIGGPEASVPEVKPVEVEPVAADETFAVAAIESAIKKLRAVGDWKVEAVHGKVPGPERDRILSAFRRGEIHALVATTVIEVGVDVPAANIMVVEGADRFGMAQLHQLRGRTGRGSAQAWCFLLEPPAAPWGGGGWPEETEARLRDFASTEDGFAIAEMDLQRRGAGSLDGAEQSGFGALRFADVLADAELIGELGKKAAEFDLR